MFDGAEHLALAVVELIFLFLARFLGLGVDLLCIPIQHPLATIFLFNHQMNGLITAALGMEFYAMIIVLI